MRNTLLIVLIVGLFAFGWINCVNNLTVANATPITTIEKLEPNYIGWNAEDVIQEMGPPHKRGQCQVKLPSGVHAQSLVTGDAARWHFDSEFEGKFTHYIRETCAIHGIVVVDTINMADRTADGKSTRHMGYTDYVLIRKILEAGPKQDGENGRYILKPGETEI